MEEVVEMFAVKNLKSTVAVSSNSKVKNPGCNSSKRLDSPACFRDPIYLIANPRFLPVPLRA